MATPNRRPGLAIAIGIGKPKPGLGSMTPVEKRGGPPAPASDPDQDQDQDQGMSVTVGPEDVDYSDNDLCETCKNMGSDGNCMKYGFGVQPSGHCESGYEPKDNGGDQDQGQDQGSSDFTGGDTDTESDYQQ